MNISEYPTAVCIMNASNDTLVGKVFIDDADEIDIPKYDNFHFIDKEEEEYKIDVSNMMLEVYSQNDVFNFGKLFLNLPDPSEIASDADSIFDKIKKG